MSTKPLIIVGDTDALISLSLSNQNTHKRVYDITAKLLGGFSTIYFPFPILMEAVVTISRKFDNKDKAKILMEQYLKGIFNVIYPTQEICNKAAQIYVTKSDSKQNTIFDAIVAACAEVVDADAILSLDGWYSKLGFKLAGEIV